ncbi:hypothetical protein DRO26_01845, partial [Candidatus Bathyarchaeota archaeon]
MKDFLQNSVALRLLYKMVNGQISEVLPVIGLEDIYYPILKQISEFNGEEGKSFLEKLNLEGYLTKHVYDKVYRCPKCRSMNLRPQLLCPKCKSVDYVQGNLIVHYVCGYIDFEERFVKPDLTLQCPKCGKTLKQIGIDYSNPGYAFKCLDCGEFFHFPFERWVCRVCNNAFQLSEAVVEDVYSYRFNEENRDKVKKAIFYVEPVIKALKEIGFSVECFCELKGKSGSVHMVDILAKNHSKELVIDVEEKGEHSVTVEDTLKFMAKFLDIKTKGS